MIPKRGPLSFWKGGRPIGLVSRRLVTIERAVSIKLAFAAVIFWMTGWNGAARASCPSQPAGQPLPAEAQPAPLLDADHWYWRQRLAQLDHVIAGADLPRVRLIFLGDSIVERWDQEVFARHYTKLQPLNLGISGDTTQGLLWRLQRIGLGGALRPSVIVLLIGTNNTYPGGNADAVAIGVGEVVRAIRRISPASRILLLGLLPRGADAADGFRHEGVAVNSLIAGCADGRFVFYAEPGRSLAAPDKGVAPDIESDALHPTRLGYSMMSDFLDAEINRLAR